MPRFGEPRAPVLTVEASQVLFEENRQLREENRQLREESQQLREEHERLRARIEELEVALRGDGRRPQPPAFVKPNVKKDPESPPKKPGAKKGHEAHQRPSPAADSDTV